MDCPGCHTKNPTEASFCMGCGAALALTCPSCGTALPAEAQFCFKCGHRIADAKAVKEPTDQVQDRIRQYIPKELLAKLESARATGGMQGERRIVTMLFCDVQGSTAAAEKLDPEEWAEIMNGAFECLMPPVYRYEGTVARLMGDAILAFFGAPIGHEDDPQRAVLAGLDIIKAVGPYREEIRDKWDIDFNVRVGINTGLVMVGEVGTDLRVEYTAMGDAVNMAARMEQTAEPGTVQITDSTYKLISPLFEFETLSGIEVKGKREPITAYRVMGLKAEPGRLRGIEGLDSPLVGRGSEMARLREGIDSLIRGHGQIWSVMGEAGLGKSRLVSELRQALVSEGLLPGNGTGGGDAPALNWLEGRSLSYEASTPYAPFVEMFRTCFDLRPGETDEERYRKVVAGVQGVMPDMVAETAPYIATVLGIKLEGDDLEMVRHLQPPQLRGRVFAATASYIEQVSVQRPLVLVFEDVHWVDPTSLELLEHLLPLTDRAALMIIAIMRPQRQDASWRIHELAAREYGHRYTSILLEPLDQDNSRLLVANLLEVEDLPTSVRELILEKAEGNPFFVEEVIRSLLDAGLVVREDNHWKATREIENITVSNTLAGVITARLDSLEEEPKRLAQTASVIGREFEFNTLEEVHEAVGETDEALGQLQRRELVREKSRLPQRVYIFKHVLTQETVYASVLRSRRRELHLRIGECLERADPENAGEIARHYLDAQEHSRALPYLLEVADRAARAYSTTEAIGFYTRALEILETAESLPLARRAYEGLGGALTFAFDIPKAVETYQTMLRLARESDDVPMQVSALNKLGFVAALMQGQFPEAQKMLEDAERLAHASSDLPGLAECHMTYCYLLTATGEFENAVDHLSESAEIGRKLELEEPRLFGMVHTANTLTYMMRFGEAHEKAEEARQVAEELGNKRWLATLSTLPDFFYHLVNGELEEAYQTAKAGSELAGQIGAADDECVGAFSMGQIARMRGEYEQAIAHFEHAVSAGRMAGLPYLPAAALSLLGGVQVEVSEKLMERAVELHAEASELMEMPLGSVMGALGWTDMGFRALTAGRLDEAEELFQKGLNTPTALKNLMRPQLLIGAASVALARNKLDEAARLTAEAREFAEAATMKQFYPAVALAQGQLKVAQDDIEGALESFTHAEETALEMGMRPQIWQARAGAARALSALDRDGDARTKLDQARAMIDEIAGLFDNTELRAMYVEGAVTKLG